MFAWPTLIVVALECDPEDHCKQTEDDERRDGVEPLERVKLAVNLKHKERLDQAKDHEERHETPSGEPAMQLGPP